MLPIATMSWSIASVHRYQEETCACSGHTRSLQRDGNEYGYPYCDGTSSLEDTRIRAALQIGAAV